MVKVLGGFAFPKTLYEITQIFTVDVDIHKSLF